MVFTEPTADAGAAEQTDQQGYGHNQVHAGVPCWWQYIEQDRQ